MLKICRACMSTDQNRLFYDLTGNNAEMFMRCTNLEISPDDGLLQHVCAQCLDLTKAFAEFLSMCHNSDATFKKCIIDVEFDLRNVKSEDMKPTLFYTAFEPNKALLQKEEPIEKLESIYTKLENGCDENINFTSYCDNNVNEIEDEEPAKRKKSLRVITKKCVHKNEESVKKKNTSRKVDFKCGLCPKSFDSYGALVSHLGSHQSDTSCGLCGQAGASWPHLVAHRQLHLTAKRYKCYVCDKIISSLLELELHIAVKHFDAKGISCKLCDKSFTQSRYLKKHTINMHSVIRPYTCDHCHKSFTIKQILKTHMATHYPEKSNQCENCEFSCKNISSLKIHMVRKHAARGCHKCTICDKVFGNAYTLADHERIHVKGKFVCPHCGKVFANIQNLQQHERRHGDIQRKFRCEQCGVDYPTQSTLSKHKLRHNGERPHACTLCHRRFYTRAVLIKHVRTHTGEKPFVCTICGKGFTCKHNLRVHMKVHGMHLIIKKIKPEVIKTNSNDI